MSAGDSDSDNGSVSSEPRAYNDMDSDQDDADTNSRTTMWIAVGPWEPISVDIKEEIALNELLLHLKDKLAPRLNYDLGVLGTLRVTFPDGRTQLDSNDSLMDIAACHASSITRPFTVTVDNGRILSPLFSCPSESESESGDGAVERNRALPAEEYVEESDIDTSEINRPIRSKGPSSKIKQIAAGSSHCLILFYDGQVWSWGTGDSGKLGFGSLSQVLAPRPIDKTLFYSVRVINVAAGDKHSIATVADGRVFTWGCGDSGRLLRGDEDWYKYPRVVPPQALDSKKHGDPCIFEAGYNGTCVIMQDSILYGCGWGCDGTYPHSADEYACFNPRVIPAFNGDVVISVASGAYHNLAVIAGGFVKSWGVSKYGVLGRIDDEDQSHGNSDMLEFHPPALVQKGLEDVFVIKVAAGYQHSLALSNDGRVFAWGRGANGRLGDGGGDDQLFPVEISIPNDEKVLDICAGWSHSVLLTQKGHVYACGAGEKGALGQGSDHSDMLTPCFVDFKEEIVCIGAGKHYTVAVPSTFLCY